MAVDDYLMVHRSEGHNAKTLEWHTTALGLLLRFLAEEVGIEDPHELETAHLRRWVVWLGTPESVALRPGRTVPAPRSKRTIHTYARSARAFGKWLLEEGLTEVDVTNHFTLPKLGKPLIRIFEEDEFARLIAACEIIGGGAVPATGGQRCRGSARIAVRVDVPERYGLSNCGAKTPDFSSGDEAPHAIRRHYPHEWFSAHCVLAIFGE